MVSILDLAAARAWLELLRGGCEGVVSLSAATGDGRMVSQAFAAGDPDAMLRWIASKDDTGEVGIYARVTTLKAVPASGRGKAEDSRELPCLWADMDIAGPGHATTAPLPETFEQCVEILREADLPDPTRWVHSGGGFYPFWFLDTPVRLDVAENLQLAAAMSAGWQNAIAAAATRLGWHYGKGVGDLARVLRIPGTVNRKEGLQRPCALLPGEGPKYSIGELWAAEQTAAAKVAALAPPVPAGSLGPAKVAEDPGDVGDRPGDHWAAQISWAEILEPHGWRYAYSVGATEHWIRPDKRTPGISATVNFSGLDNLYVFSDAAAPFEPGGSYTKFAAYALLNHGGSFAAAGSALRTAGFGAAQAPAPMGTIWMPEGGVPNGAAAAKSLDVAVLGDEFWTARAWLTHIRTAAHAQQRSALGVLGAVLARDAAFINHRVRLPAIVGGGEIGLSLIVAILAAPGVGKSSAVAIAKSLVPKPTYDTLDVTADVPLGSGEGIAEMYYGTLMKPTGEVYTVGEKKGEAKLKAVRAQVRHNALVDVDEGQVIGELARRSGATVLPTIRSAFTGGTLGQFNANSENRRIVEAGTYTLGMIIALQETLAAALLDDAQGGTPQRVLWLPARDPSIPPRAGRAGWPGPLEFVASEPRAYRDGPVTLSVAYSVAEELSSLDEERVTGRAVIGALDAHEGLLRLKLAGLFAHRDRRLDITADDWALATMLKSASDQTRDAVIGTLKTEAIRKEGQYAAKLAARAVATETAVAEGRVSQCARKVAAKIWAAPERWTVGDLRSELRRWREEYHDGVDEAVRRGWVIEMEETGQGRPKRILRPGAVRPS